MPTIHVKDLSKIVKLILDKKPEQKYIFAVDRTINYKLKDIITSISRGIGSGNTESIPLVQEQLNFDKQDFYIDPSREQSKKLFLYVTNNELSWNGFLNIDLLLDKGKFGDEEDENEEGEQKEEGEEENKTNLDEEEQNKYPWKDLPPVIDQDFEWHNQFGIEVNINTLLSEFATFRKLRPIKIVLNGDDKHSRQIYSKAISKFFNIPIVNYEKIQEMLNIVEDKLTEEEKFMNKNFIFLKHRLLSLDPEFKNEANELLYDANEITFEVLKHLLNSNVCKNRGYVLEGLPVNLEEVERLYYKKVEIIPEEGEEEEVEDIEEEEAEDDVNNNEEGKESSRTMKLVETDENQDKSEEVDVNKQIEYLDNNLSNEGEENQNNKDNLENKVKEEGEGEELKIIEEKPNKKKKKIKPKVYKTIFDKDLLPESVISLSSCNINYF